MNYWERHIGDYARDTAHLSLLEHGVYTILLDRYYATEQGIPADQAHRLARARADEERAAVDAVLSEFFQLVDGRWVNRRVEEEIAKASVKINAARENGKRGGRPKKNQEQTQQEPSGLSLGYQNETQQKAHQTPDTSNTEPNGSDAGASSPAAVDPIWGTGLAFLRRKGIPEKTARSLLGRIKQACGDIEAGALLADAEAQDITDPAPWLMAAASKRRARAGPNGHAPQSKTLTAIQTLQAMKHGNRVDPQRDSGRAEQAALPGPGPHARQ